MIPAKKFKILHLTSHLNVGGITRYIQLLGSEMTRRGHRVAVLSGGGSLEGAFKAAGIDVFRFAVKRKSIVDPSLYFPVFKIARLIRQEKYHVIHAHTRVTQALSFFLRLLTGVPAVSTCHGYFKYNLGRRLFPFWGEKVVAISRPVADELQSLHRLPASRVRVVENAINYDESLLRLSQKNFVSIRARHGIPAKSTVITSIGRLVPDKGNEILLRAACELSEAFPEIFVLIVGEGRQREHLNRLIPQLNLSGRAAIVPHMEDISEALAVTDIYTHPAFYREGFGLAIAEAMAASKPVVITDIPAINKIFRPGECCVMAKPADISSLAGAIRFLMEAPGEKERIAQAGYELIRPLCSMERMADQMESVYREVVKARGAA